MFIIKVTTERKTKKAGTKNAYFTESTQTEEISEREYKNIVESAPFFRRLGGSVSQIKSFTCNGYRVIQDTATSPNRESKTVRKFEFLYINK